MRVEALKQREWSEGLLNRAVEFHGHGGPFMIAGLRMGMAVLRRLDAKGWFDLRCRVALRWRPPDSCVIDGIQCSTGCTMGKRNIEVEEGDGIVAEFTKGGEHLRMALRGEVLQKMRSTLTEKGEKQIVDLIAELIAAADLDLFEIS